MWHACTQHTHSHTPGRKIEPLVDCRATLLSSPTDECGLCHGLTVALPINQRQLRLLRATVGRAFIVNDKAFGLGSARLGSAWLARLLLRVVAMCAVLRRGLRNAAATALQQATSATWQRLHRQLFNYFWLDSSIFFLAVLCLCCTSMTNCCICKKRPANATVCVCVEECIGACVCVCVGKHVSNAYVLV